MYLGSIIESISPYASSKKRSSEAKAAKAKAKERLALIDAKTAANLAAGDAAAASAKSAAFATWVPVVGGLAALAVVGIALAVASRNKSKRGAA